MFQLLHVFQFRFQYECVCLCLYYMHALYALLLYMFVKLSAICLVTELNFYLLTYLLTEYQLNALFQFQ